MCGLHAASMDIDTRHQGVQLVIHRFLGDVEHHGVSTGQKTPPDYNIGGDDEKAVSVQDEDASATLSGTKRRLGGDDPQAGNDGDAWVVDLQERTLLSRLFCVLSCTFGYHSHVRSVRP